MASRSGPKLDATGRDLVRKCIIEGHNGPHICKVLEKAGYPGISHQAIWKYRNDAEVVAARAAFRQECQQTDLADLSLLITTVTENVWRFHWLMQGFQPDPECVSIRMDGQAVKLTPKQIVGYSNECRRWTLTLMKLLGYDGEVLIGRGAGVGGGAGDASSPANGPQQSVIGMKNLINDIMERYIAERDGISIAEVRVQADAIIEQKRLAAARPAEAQVSDAAE